jgi:hypothetical protein
MDAVAGDPASTGPTTVRGVDVDDAMDKEGGAATDCNDVTAIMKAINSSLVWVHMRSLNVET